MHRGSQMCAAFLALINDAFLIALNYQHNNTTSVNE